MAITICLTRHPPMSHVGRGRLQCTRVRGFVAFEIVKREKPSVYQYADREYLLPSVDLASSIPVGVMTADAGSGGGAALSAFVPVIAIWFFQVMSSA